VPASAAAAGISHPMTDIRMGSLFDKVPSHIAEANMVAGMPPKAKQEGRRHRSAGASQEQAAGKPQDPLALP
jgi:hypothetical protein